MQEIIMPQVGQDVAWGKIVAWHKREGDTINVGDQVCEVESEKMSLDVESEVAGVLLKQLYAEGEKAEVFKPIALVGVPGEKIDLPEVSAGAESATAAPPVEAPRSSSPAPSGTAPVAAASPAAKKLAKSHGIDLATITGSGPRGRITQADVEAVIARGGA